MGIRREKIVLELDDDLSPGLLRAAAAAKILDRELNSLSGRAVQTSRSSANVSRDLDGIGKSARNADQGINQLTGRLRVLSEVAAILGPALTPLGGVAIAGVAGLSSQLGFAAIGAGVLIGSMQGLGDALSALNKADLEPTAENLAKAEDALNRLSPAAANFAREANDLAPRLRAIRDVGAEALFPGLAESLDDLERLGPKVASIFDAIGGAIGDIAENAAGSLASERWAGFLDFIETEAPQALSELASTIGDFTHGLAELWEAFTPINDGFSSWLMDVASSFDDWATGLDQTQGFQEFVDYIQTTGPQVDDTLGALGNALVQIVQATAPLGGPVLAGIEAFADAVAAIADSDLGTPILAGVAALSLLNRTLAVTASLSNVSLSSGIFSGLGTVGSGVKSGAAGIRALSGDIGVLARNYATAGKASERMAAQNKVAKENIAKTGAAAGKAAGLVGGLALASSGAADGFGLTNTMSLALMGTIAGPFGAAAGAGIGAFLDIKAAAADANAEFETFKDSLAGMSSEQLTAGLAQINALLSATSEGGIVNDFLAERKSAIEDQIEVTQDLEDAQAAQEAQERGNAEAYARAIGLNFDVGNSAEVTTEQIKKQTKAFEEAREAAVESARGTATAFFGIGDAVNDADVSLDGWIKSLRDQADALRNFRINAETAADRGLRKGLINALQEAGPEGALRMRQLANGTKEQIDKANDAWKSGVDEMRKYVNFKVPPKKITVEDIQAMTAIERIRNALVGLKDKTVTVRVTQTGVSTSSDFGPQDYTGSADGGTVPKTGRRYADRHLYLLADGEEVISNRYGQADRHRPLLKAINGGLADGGTSGKKKPKPTGGMYVFDNTDRLQQAIDNLTEVASRQTDALEAATSKQEYWADKMSDLAKATVSGFNTGLFEATSSGRAGNPLANLTKDIAGLNQRQGLQTQLAGLGLSGESLAALLSEAQGVEGNRQIASMIAAGTVSQYADLYAQRAALQGSVGGYAGQAAFGGEYAAAAADRKLLAAAVDKTSLAIVRLETRQGMTEQALASLQNAPERTGAEVGRVINSASADAARSGSGGRRVR